MLIKYTGKKFIFIANTKTASTSIENSILADMAQIKLINNRIGKHMSIEMIYEKFPFIFDEFPIERFFIFGVIRDPLSWVISLFNYMSRPEIANPKARHNNTFAGDISFEEFWRKNINRAFLRPQYYKFFSEREKNLRVNFLLRHQNLEQDLEVVSSILNIKKIKLLRENISTNKRISLAQIPQDLKNEIEEYFYKDREIINNQNEINLEGINRFLEITHEKRIILSSEKNLKNKILEFIKKYKTIKL